MSASNKRPVGDAEREELLAVYLSITGLHRMSFDDCLRNQIILICLRNTALARRRARAARERSAPESFELTP